MKILILGAKGSMGQTLSEVYKDQEVFAWDRQDLDITNEDDVVRKITELKPDVIFNCAAYTDVNSAESNVELANSINGRAVGYVARAAKEAGAILVHFSTSAVFSGGNPDGYSETDQPKDSANAYGRSKLLGEQELMRNTDRYFLVRTNWIYGRTSKGKKNFVEQMLEKVNEAEIEMVSDEFSHPTYVQDLAQATRELVSSGKSFGTYHITNSGVASWRDWALHLFELKGIKTPLIPISRTVYKRVAQRPQYAILKNSKLPQLRSWKEALADFLKQHG